MEKKFLEYLEEEIAKTSTIIDGVKKKFNPNLKGVVWTRKIKNSDRLFYKLPDGKAKYVNRYEQSNAKAIIKNNFYREEIKILSKRLVVLNKALKELQNNSVYDLYNNLPLYKQKFVDKYFETDEEFIARWKEDHPHCDSMDVTSFETKSGFFVKSKSEKIIADALFDNNIPFVYEIRVSFGNTESFVPDFAICDVKNRKTVIWEHFGLINDPDYRNKTVYKLIRYADSGYNLGDNFIYSLEGNSINCSNQIKANIKWIKNGGTWAHMKAADYLF